MERIIYNQNKGRREKEGKILIFWEGDEEMKCTLILCIFLKSIDDTYKKLH